MQHRLLSSQSALGEGRCKESANLCMLLRVDSAEKRVWRAWLAGPPSWVFEELALSIWTWLKDVRPCFFLGKGNLVRRNAYDRPVLRVDSLKVMHNSSSQKRRHERESGCRPSSWPRDLGKGMKVHVVDGLDEGILDFWHSYVSYSRPQLHIRVSLTEDGVVFLTERNASNTVAVSRSTCEARLFSLYNIIMIWQCRSKDAFDRVLE